MSITTIVSLEGKLVNDEELDMSVDNTREITAYLDSSISPAAKSLPSYVWDMSFQQLYKKAILSMDGNVLLDLRRQFWEQYEVARASNSKINSKEVAYGVCSFEYFKSAIKCHEALAYIVSPLPSTEATQRALLNIGIERMQEIMTVSARYIDPQTGLEKINDRLAKVQFTITEMLMNRLLGMPVERQHNMNVNVNTSASDAASQKANIAAITNMDELERRLAELKERQARRLAPPTTPIEPNLKKLVRPDIVE